MTTYAEHAPPLRSRRTAALVAVAVAALAAILIAVTPAPRRSAPLPAAARPAAPCTAPAPDGCRAPRRGPYAAGRLRPPRRFARGAPEPVRAR